MKRSGFIARCRVMPASFQLIFVGQVGQCYGDCTERKEADAVGHAIIAGFQVDENHQTAERCIYKCTDEFHCGIRSLFEALLSALFSRLFVQHTYGDDASETIQPIARSSASASAHFRKMA